MRFLSYVKICLLCVLAVSLAACEDEQDVVDNALIGRSWTGYVGMQNEHGERVLSTFYFGADGFGEELQRYYDGEVYDKFRFQWWWEDGYSRNLVLDYGRVGGISYMDNVRVDGMRLWGAFYFSQASPGFNFTLDMDY